jgi:hypothetical protein
MPPVTRKMSDHQDAWEHVVANVLLYEDPGNLRSGLMVLGIKDITGFLLIELENFQGLESFFYTAGEKST